MFFFGFGIFGGHHFYLKRDRHAFVHFATISCLGICLIYDFFHIPGYVRLENNLRFNQPIAFFDPNERPSFNMTRFICQILFGAYLGTLSLAMFPVEALEEYYFHIIILHAIAVTIGVHTIANIGSVRCSLGSCFVGSALVIPYAYLVLDSKTINNAIFLSALSSSFVALQRGWKYASTKDINDRNVLIRFIFVYALGSLLLTATFSAIYFNTRIVTQGGMKVPLSDYVARELPWEDLKAGIRKLTETLKEQGFVEFVLRSLEMLSVDGFDQEAFKVLELDENATEEQVISQYRKLARKYHPDKYVKSNPWEKKWAEKQFILVRQSYEQVLPYVRRYGMSSASNKRNNKTAATDVHHNVKDEL
ncbi:hypothetical protein HELRODRAFT_172395 [Helobdella robusta]|uniref:J domain-containing protein n=1 Tax=Helobdella robusta TaxID=6412 RepID=T1F593_HELRO|nr:hypothetical protein HELRODRAFT_172395 [Helobdella robusta]ESO04720.1 hypothetical protein HELRODRAFT_172395 [Helobdella robusta]